jgi:hypothetical protein
MLSTNKQFFFSFLLSLLFHAKILGPYYIKSSSMYTNCIIKKIFFFDLHNSLLNLKETNLDTMLDFVPAPLFF